MTVHHLLDKSTDPEVIDCARPSTACSALRKLEPDAGNHRRRDARRSVKENAGWRAP